MQFVCDAPNQEAWFRIETEGEALRESEAMSHAVEKHFRKAREAAVASYVPTSGSFIEQDIGLGAHIQRTMPVFVTLRNSEGTALVTAMLPPGAQEAPGFRPVVVGAANGDPYPQHGQAIEALGSHFGLKLDRGRCFPYGRG